MRKTTCILPILLLCTPVLVLAQSTPQREQVILHFAGTLTTGDELILHLRQRVLDRALNERSLVSLTMEGRSTASPDSVRLLSSVRLEFAFPSLEAYRTWRDSDSAKELITQLKEALSAVEFQLSIQRVVVSKS